MSSHREGGREVERERGREGVRALVSLPFPIMPQSHQIRAPPVRLFNLNHLLIGPMSKYTSGLGLKYEFRNTIQFIAQVGLHRLHGSARSKVFNRVKISV